MGRPVHRRNAKTWYDFGLIGTQPGGEVDNRREFTPAEHAHLHYSEALAHLTDALRHLRMLLTHTESNAPALGRLLTRTLELASDLSAEWERGTTDPAD